MEGPALPVYALAERRKFAEDEKRRTEEANKVITEKNRTLEALYSEIRDKNRQLEELATKTYPLDGINDAFAAMGAGEVARAVIVF